MANTDQPTYSIRKEPDGIAYRDQILSVVRDRKQASERTSASIRRSLPKYYDLWRGLYSGRFTPTKNNIHIPLIYSTIWSDVARKLATHFSQWPAVSFHGFGPDDEPVSRKVEALVNAQFQDAQIIEKEMTTFLSADLYGTAVSQVMWDHKEDVRDITRFQAMPLNGELVRQIERRQVITFDGPNYKNIDLLDFFPQPGYKEINGNQGMQWCIVRYYLDLDQCRLMSSEAGGAVFDRNEVDALARESALPQSRVDEASLRRFEVRQGLSPSNKATDRFSRPVEIIEMWGHLPSELAGAFGTTNVVISVANDRFILRARANPFSHGQKPFISYSPTPDPHYFHAPGKAEVAYQMQIAGNRFINHQLDAADLLVHPMFIYDKDRAAINPRKLVAGPGRTFGVSAAGGNLDNVLRPLQMDYRGLQVGGEMTSILWNYIQMGSGVQEDTVMGGGGGGSDRQTAREFLGRREASGTRLMLESVMYDARYLEPLANMFASMNQQFLELPREVLILGESASTDPVTGQPIRSTREAVSAGDLDRQYAARANGTTMSISKETQKANDLTLLQIVAGAGDAVAGSFNMVNFLRQIMRDLGFRNVNELIQKAPSVQEQLAQSGMNQASDVPTDAGGLAEMMGGAAPSGPFSGIPQP